MPAPRKRSAAKPKAKPAATPAMPAGQKTIFNKLKRKGLSDKQAHAMSKNAHKRKMATVSKGPTTKATPKRARRKK